MSTSKSVQVDGAPTSSDTDRPLMELRGVTKRFGGHRALDDVSITVRRHEVIGLIGENGAGKSTLLKLLAGVHRPDEGEIHVGGARVVIGSPQASARLGIGVVHQEQSLLPNLSVAENVTLGESGVVNAAGFVRRRRMVERAQQLLDTVGSKVDPTTPTSELSFAERQMVEIARALANQVADRPPLVVLDEPTSVLEKEDVAILREKVRLLREIGSVVFVSHRLDEVLDFSDRVYVLRDGKLVGERVASEAREDDLYRMMVGRESAQGYYRDDLRTPPAPSAAPVLKVSALTRRGAFSDVDLEVRRGEIVTLVGVVGSGRESVARAVFGAEPTHGGTVELDGQRLALRSPADAVRAGIAYVPAERRTEGMVAGTTVAENIALVSPRSAGGRIVSTPGRRRATALEWIRTLSIRPDDPDADMGRLSGGNQQKAALARWLVDPDLRLLILDHPTRGVDIGAKEDIYGLVRELCGRGLGVLLLADTLDEATGLSDTVLVMRDGRVVERYVGADGRPAAPTHLQLLEKMM